MLQVRLGCHTGVAAHHRNLDMTVGSLLKRPRQDEESRAMSRRSKPLSKATAADVMTSPAAYVEVETPLREIARLMILEGISAVPVVDQAGNLAGIVSEGDLIRRNTKGHEAKRSWWLDLFDAALRFSPTWSGMASGRRT
jgi:CBS-domain-containing membrane protein